LPRPRRSSSWTRDNFAALKEAAEETTNHGELLDVTPYVVGNSVYLRFRYDTKDAMGMNMATIATEAVCGVVEAETVACLSPLGQPLFRQEARRHQRRRGARPERHRRRSNPARGRRRTPAHHARSGRGTQHTQEPGRFREGREPGFNAHVANVVAAMFLATGQDEAQVVEGANAITTAEVQDGDLYVSVSIASLEVGTVGGGTKLLTQSEGLDILGVSGGGDPAGSNADALAECIAVGSLRGRTLLLPRSPPRHLSSAHAELGR